jgi:hypothetical protein
MYVGEGPTIAVAVPDPDGVRVLVNKIGDPRGSLFTEDPIEEA